MDPEHPQVSTLPPRRTLIVYATFAVVVGGHLRDIATDNEHWPFSPYPMYSYPPPEQLHAYRLVGVVGAGGDEEFPLVRADHLSPLNPGTLGAAFGRLHKRRDGGMLLDQAMQECLARYESRRAAGRHDGPRLKGVRLYRLSWAADRSAAAGDGPDRRELVREYYFDEGQPR